MEAIKDFVYMLYDDHFIVTCVVFVVLQILLFALAVATAKEPFWIALVGAVIVPLIGLDMINSRSFIWFPDMIYFVFHIIYICPVYCFVLPYPCFVPCCACECYIVGAKCY